MAAAEAEELHSTAADLQRDLAAALAGSATEDQFETLAARAYECIDYHTRTDSPYLARAKVVLESATLPAKDRANGMVTLLVAFSNHCQADRYRIPIDPSNFYDSFRRHSEALRNWFIAFGVGVPALLLTHDDLFRRVVASSNAGLLAALFFSGVGVQVGKAFLFKATSWAPSMDKGRTWARFSNWAHESLGLDLGADAVTAVLFGLAAAITFIALASPRC